MSFFGSLLGGIGSAISGAEEGAAAETAANAQAQLSGQEVQGLQTLLNQYNQSYSPLIPSAASAIGAEASGAGSQANDLASLFQQAGIDPAVIAQLTGVNANQLASQATGYLSTPGATQVGQIGPGVVQSLLNPNTALSGVSPGLSSFYQNEQQNGINPQFSNNAVNQLVQGFNQSQSDINAHAQPGQSTAAQNQDAQNSLLSNLTNLTGNLAGQSQQFANTGAQGVASTASNLDTQQQQRMLAALQSAGVIDTQTASNLTQALQLGSGYNQTQLSNIGNATNSSQNTLDQLMNFLNAGRQDVVPGLSAMGQLGQSYGNTASQLGTAAGNSFSSALTGLGNYFGNQSSSDSSPDLSSNILSAQAGMSPSASTGIDTGADQTLGL